MSHLPARFVLGLGLVLGLCAAPLCAATVYKWKDAKGVTHYSDSPPPTGAYREIAAPADKPSRVATPQAAAPKGPPPISADCAQARLNRQHLQGSAPVGLDADRDGKPDTVMADDERARQLAQAESAVRAHCPGGT